MYSRLSHVPQARYKPYIAGVLRPLGVSRHHPEGNSYIERFHRGLKDEFGPPRIETSRKHWVGSPAEWFEAPFLEHLALCTRQESASGLTTVRPAATTPMLLQVS